MQAGASFQDTTVLVTGGQGFIGSWVAERLLEAGARVVVPIRDVHPEKRFHAEGLDKRCILEPADVRDYDALLRILHGTRCRRSSTSRRSRSWASPIAPRSPPGRATWQAHMPSWRRAGAGAPSARPIERIVVASSDHAYGPHADSPLREDSPLAPRYPYDVSKGCADMIAHSYASTYGMPVAVTRLANVFGGGDRNWSRIVPDTARSLARGERPVIRSDGSPQRDYLYVEDAAEAYLSVAESLDRTENHGRAWNASLGRPVSVLELVRRLIAVSGSDVEPDIQGEGTPHAEADSLPDRLGRHPGGTRLVAAVEPRRGARQDLRLVRGPAAAVLGNERGRELRRPLGPRDRRRRASSAPGWWSGCWTRVRACSCPSAPPRSGRASCSAGSSRAVRPCPWTCSTSRLVLRVLEEHEVDAVFHLAAHTVVGEADRSPLPAFETNIRGTYNLLEACRMARGKADRHVVIASSAHVYGKQQGLPCPETAPLRSGGSLRRVKGVRGHDRPVLCRHARHANCRDPDVERLRRRGPELLAAGPARAFARSSQETRP